MKYVRFGIRGEEKPGVLDTNGRIRDLSVLIEDLSGDVLSYLPVLNSIDVDSLPLVNEGCRLGSPIAGTGKFICVGLNYADHAAESGMDMPSEPVLFMKATSAICGPNDPIVIPKKSNKTDWEVELAVVIGKPAKYVSERDAIRHIAGYAITNDVSEREFQIERQGQWTKGKSCDNFGQIGPWLVTPDEIPDPQNLKLWLTVNGKSFQNGSTRTMVYGVTHLISYISQFMTLEPGDVISTGTPPGVGLGQTPPEYLKPGDIVELGIDGLGQQRQETISD